MDEPFVFMLFGGLVLLLSMSVMLFIARKILRAAMRRGGAGWSDLARVYPSPGNVTGETVKRVTVLAGLVRYKRMVTATIAEQGLELRRSGFPFGGSPAALYFPWSAIRVIRPGTWPLSGLMAMDLVDGSTIEVSNSLAELLQLRFAGR